MKKKTVAILIGLMMTATMLNGCGQKEDTQNTTQQTTGNVTEESGEGEQEAQESQEIFGEVESVSDNSITIAVGTMKQRGDAPMGDAATITVQSRGGGMGGSPNHSQGEGELQ